MKNRTYIFTLILSNWICFSGGAITACSENTSTFNKCIEDELNLLIPTLKHGWANEDVPGIDPVVLPQVNTSFSNNAMSISLVTQDVIITGLSDARVQAVKTKNLYMGKLELVLKVPDIKILGNYTSEGEMATFPLSSQGYFNISMEDVTVVCIVYLERYSLGKGNRLAVKSLALDIAPSQVHIKPADQLDGNNQLGKTLEDYLNENSYELYNMVKIPLMNYLSNLARIMINSYMARVPDNHLVPV